MELRRRLREPPLQLDERRAAGQLPRVAVLLAGGTVRPAIRVEREAMAGRPRLMLRRFAVELHMPDHARRVASESWPCVTRSGVWD